MGVIDLRLLGRRTTHLGHKALSRYGEWKLVPHTTVNIVLHLQLPFFPRYCPLQRSVILQEGSTDMSR